MSVAVNNKMPDPMEDIVLVVIAITSFIWLCI